MSSYSEYSPSRTLSFQIPWLAVSTWAAVWVFLLPPGARWEEVSKKTRTQTFQISYWQASRCQAAFCRQCSAKCHSKHQATLNWIPQIISLIKPWGSCFVFTSDCAWEIQANSTPGSLDFARLCSLVVSEAGGTAVWGTEPRDSSPQEWASGQPCFPEVGRGPEQGLSFLDTVTQRPSRAPGGPTHPPARLQLEICDGVSPKPSSS